MVLGAACTHLCLYYRLSACTLSCSWCWVLHVLTNVYIIDCPNRTTCGFWCRRIPTSSGSLFQLSTCTPSCSWCWVLHILTFVFIIDWVPVLHHAHGAGDCMYSLMFFIIDWVPVLHHVHAAGCCPLPALCPLRLRLQVYGQAHILPPG